MQRKKNFIFYFGVDMMEETSSSSQRPTTPVVEDENADTENSSNHGQERKRRRRDEVESVHPTPLPIVSGDVSVIQEVMVPPPPLPFEPFLPEIFHQALFHPPFFEIPDIEEDDIMGDLEIPGDDEVVAGGFEYGPQFGLFGGDHDVPQPHREPSSSLRVHLNKLYIKIPHLRAEVQAQPLLTEFIRFCHEQVSYSRRGGNWMRRVNPPTSALKRMRTWLDSHSFQLLDWSSPLMRCIVRYAITINDQAWVRLLTEFGADITELDQGCLYDLAFTPNNRPTVYSNGPIGTSSIDTKWMSMVEYLVNVLDINVDCLEFDSFVRDNTHQQPTLYDLTLLRFLLESTGRVPDFTCMVRSTSIKSRYRSFNMYMGHDEALINFFCVILSNNLLAKANDEMLDILSNSSELRPINMAEMKIIFEDISVSTHPRNNMNRMSFTLFTSLVKVLKQRRGNPDRSEELLLLLMELIVQNSGYNNILDIACLFTSKVSVDICKLCAQEGYLTALKRVLEIAHYYYSTNSTSSSSSDPMRGYHDLLQTTLVYCETFSVLRYCIEECNVPADTVKTFFRESRDVLFSICSALLHSRNNRNIGDVIPCIEYLGGLPGYSMAKCILVNPIGLFHNLLKGDCYNIIDALLQWGFGYDMKISAPLYTSSKCSNINDCLILKDNVVMNPVGFFIVTKIGAIVVNLVKHLINDHGADVNASDSNGDTALIHAIRQKEYSLARTLVMDFQANVQIKNHAGESAETHYGVTNEAYFQPVLQTLQNHEYCYDEAIKELLEHEQSSLSVFIEDLEFWDEPFLDAFLDDGARSSEFSVTNF